MTVQVAPAGSPASALGFERSTPRPVQSAVTVPAGASLPADGKTPPRVDPVPMPQMDFERSRAALEQFVRSIRRELEFRVDEASGRTIITVRNKETGEVVRQIPGEEVVALARALAEGRPTLLESEA